MTSSFRPLLLPALVALLVTLAGAATAPAATAPSCEGGRAGTPGRDVIVGESRAIDLRSGADRIRGLEGNDRITGDDDSGSGGPDCLHGGPGRDVLIGEGGVDTLVGGAGDDVLYDDGVHADAILGSPEADRMLGGTGDDVILASSGRNAIDAGPGADRVRAANGVAETIRCGSGRDDVSADREDALLGCERVRRLISPFPEIVPARGGPQTTFVVRWRAVHDVDDFTRTNDEAPADPDLLRGYEITLPGRRGARCGRRGALVFERTNFKEGAIVRARLRPPPGGWCRGTHRVRVDEMDVDDTSEPEPAVCDNGPESGSSQCDGGTPGEQTQTRERFGRLAFQVR